MNSFDKLVRGLRRLPGIGPRQAERLSLHLLRVSETEASTLIAALREAREKVRPCTVCFDYSDQPVCRLCNDPGRDEAVVCVVEEPSDLAAIERSRGFRGRYHVLHGALSPLDAVGPDALKIQELVSRVQASGGKVQEVILATDHDTEGDATALYLTQRLAGLPVRVTRIAMGVPLGGDLAYIDEQTLSEALVGRRTV